MNPQNLNELRGEMDRIDRELVRLLCERMETSAKIAAVKRETGKPVYDPAREREKLNAVSEMAGEEFAGTARQVWSLLMEVSRDYQNKLNRAPSPLQEEIARAIEETPALFPEAPAVACQGTEGAYSTAAAGKLFPRPDITYCKTFEGVLHAVESGMVRYGVLPAENSTAGPVGEVWSLLEKHGVYIVRAVRVRVEHGLLALPGTKLSDVREIVSHEQAIAQCGKFLDSLDGVKITYADNTAVAARTVRESGRHDLAAISSKNCAAVYGLEVLAQSIQNTADNVTRFLCVSKKPEVYPGSDRTTVMLTTPNEPGALYRVLSRFHALGINLTSLKSRPIEGRDYEFRFLLDFETSVHSPAFAELMQSITGECGELKYLGSYLEKA